jgi:hypothetical protein
MKNRIITIASVAGVLALFLVHFGSQMTALSHAIVWYSFVGGFALAFLSAVLAAQSWVTHWRSVRIAGRFLWCFAVLAGFAGMLVYGP